MSQMNSSDNPFSLKRIAPNTEINATQPNYKSAQLSGGQIQLGQTAQQVAATGDAAMYAGLAEIAGGIGKAIDTFADIGKRVDEEKINIVQMNFEKLDNDPKLTPEEKQNQLDASMKDVWTPVLGDSWKEKLSLSVNKKWLSDEARNTFEQTRYTKELASFLDRNQTRTDSPELIQQFNKEYSSKFPTAKYNDWFKIKNFETNSKINQKTVDDQLSMVELAIVQSIAVPSPDLQKAARAGDQAVIGKYKPFFDLVDDARLAPDLEHFSGTVYDLLTEQFLRPLAKATTPIEVVQEITRRLPELSTKIAKQIFDAANDFNLSLVQENAATSLVLGQSNFKDTADKIDGLGIYLGTMTRHLGTMDMSRVEKRSLIQNTIPLVYEQFSLAMETGTDSRLQEKYPNWFSLTPIEKLDIVEKEINDWMSKGNNANGVVALMGFSPEEIKQSGLTANQLAEKILIQNGRTNVLLSEKTRKEINQNAEDAIENLELKVAAFDLYGDELELKTSVDSSLKTISTKLGVDINNLRDLYLEDKNTGVLKAKINYAEWYNSLTPEAQKKMIHDGFTLNNFELLRKYSTVASKIDLAGIKNVKRIQEEEARLKAEQLRQGIAAGKEKIAEEKAALAERKNIIKPDTLLPQAAKFSMGPGTGNDNAANGSIQSATLTGSLYSGENSQFKSVLQNALQSLKIINEWKKQNPDLEWESYEEIPPEEVNDAIRFINIVNEDAPIILQHAQAIENLKIEIVHNFPELWSNIPSLNPVTPKTDTPPDALIRDFAKRTDDWINGKISLDISRIPLSPIENEQWTAESLFTFSQVQVTGRSFLKSDSPIEDKRFFGKMYLTVLERIGNGNQDYLKSDMGKYDLTLLSLMGKAYKRAYDSTGTLPEIHGLPFQITRALVGANWAEETNVEGMIAGMNDPEEIKRVQAQLGIVIELARFSAGDKQLAATATVGETNPKDIFFKNKDGIVISSAFVAQASFLPLAMDPNVKLPNKPISPRNKEWDPDILVASINRVFQEKYTKEDVAKVLEPVLLASFPIGTLADMSPEQKLKISAQIIERATENNPALFELANELFFNGIQNGTIKPNNKAGETYLSLYAHHIDVVLDIDSQANKPQSAGHRIGVSPVNTMITFRGTTIDADNNQFFELGNSATVYGNDPESTFSLALINESQDAVAKQLAILPIMKSSFWGGNQETTKMGYPIYVAELEKIFTPDKLVDPNNESIGKANGPMFVVGSVILSDLYLSDKYFKAALDPWFRANGTDSPPMRNIPATIQKCIDSRLSFFDTLVAIDIKYREDGGKLPFMKSEGLDRKTPGFSELRQNLTYNRDKRANLPTWDFVLRGMDGVALLSINDAFMLVDQKNGEPVPKNIYSEATINRIKDEAEKQSKATKVDLESYRKQLRKN